MVSIDLRQDFEAYLAYSDAYRSACNILAKERHRTSLLFEIGPIYQNAGLAYELLFKSLLLRSGETRDGVRKKYGHDLWELFVAVDDRKDIDLEEILKETQAQWLETAFNNTSQQLPKLSISDREEWLKFHNQILALNQNYLRLDEDKKRTYPSRYIHTERRYAPLSLDILLPCLDTLIEYATAFATPAEC
ncbi:MAG: hypothetical protein KGZ72_13860 [Roseovarius sp.]|jgi:hypothetical protein|nr:hypothetical protein [Roseovarius sp.]